MAEKGERMVVTVPDHIYEKADLIRRLEAYRGKTFELIDNKGMFDHVREFPLHFRV